MKESKVASGRDVLNKLCTYNERGEEVLDSTPMALPVDFKRPIPLGERVRQLVHSEVLNRELGALGVETFEEADDFECDDETFDPATPFEDRFEPDVPGLAARQDEIRAGIVQEIEPERKVRAYERLGKLRKQVAGRSRGPRVNDVEEEPRRKGGKSKIRHNSDSEPVESGDEGDDE